MKKMNIVIVCCLLAGGVLGLGTSRAIDPPAALTVQPIPGQFFVILDNQTPLLDTEALLTRIEKGRYVYDTLTAHAHQSQQPLRQWLDRQGVVYKSYWIRNMLLVHGDDTLQHVLAARPEVAAVVPNRRYQAIDPKAWRNARKESASRGTEWNLQQIRAESVWNDLGIKGDGIVVCDNDTGVDWDHPALINQYRGWNGAAADH
ncbi:hypothetical protein JXA80_05530, partial [bacterium]|nr:hypothetical protein [candidate division CSSED10-310 bacterium]